MVDDVAVVESAVATGTTVVALSLSQANPVTVSDAWTPVLKPGGLIQGTARASDTWSWGSASINATAVESAKARDQWRVSRTVSLATSAAASDAWAPTILNQVTERARASIVVDVQASYKLAQTASARASDAWAFEHTRSLVDSAAASDQWSYTYRGGVQVSESAVASLSVATKRMVFAEVSDTALASLVYVVEAAYAVTVLEPGVASEWLSPGNDSTAWAINTRTQAITEYQGFAFNSFAQIGRKFIAAGPEGLYELDGPTDDGQDVRARIGGGFFAPNGPKMSGFKGAYIGARGQGRYLLKLVSGDGREFIYRAHLNPNFMTTKVDMGKGLKGRYWRWELINEDGQDFDLDTVEFIPMMSGRRV